MKEISSPEGGRRRLLAGSYGPERLPAHPNPEDAHWFEPLHVRAEATAREHVAAQIAAGADMVVAPTWLTHRRALSRLGETRNAAAWTAAAVRVTRDGVESGLERREGAASEDLGGVSATRPRPLVAAVLPTLDDGPTPETGRLPSAEAATQRDYRDQAGMLAAAEPDLILVEASPKAAEARVAIEAAVGTGIPTWAAAALALAHARDDGASLSRWLETSQHTGIEVALLPPPVELAARVATDATLPWGGLFPQDLANESVEPAVRAYLAHSARVVALLDGATPERLTPVRVAIDEHEAVELAEHARQADRWRDFVAEAARMAPGGSALWLADALPGGLPDGFDWLVLESTSIPRLSPAHFSLIVRGDSGAAERIEPLGPLLRDGGVLAVATDGLARDIEGLRVLSVDVQRTPTLMLLRREG